MANPTFKITMANGGVIEGKLYPEKAPQSVANFVDLCQLFNSTNSNLLNYLVWFHFSHYGFIFK